MAYVLIVRPMLMCYEAKNWVQTPCLINFSQVKYYFGPKTEHSVNITFKYKFNKLQHTSDRYSVYPFSSEDYDYIRSIVNEYPVGKETVCYVNPNNPNEAVISRDIKEKDLEIGPPILFIFLGLVGCIIVIRSIVRQTGVKNFSEFLRAIQRNDLK